MFRAIHFALFLLAPLALASDPGVELQSGIDLTRHGRFQEAIGHFLAARSSLHDSFPLEFNLALCYVATREFKPAIQILSQLDETPAHQAEISDLLAQAYIGDHERKAAMDSFQRAAQSAPTSEKLYLHVAEACFDEAQYDDGLQVVTTGLSHLPDSPRLLFERAMFRTQTERMELAREDFEMVRRLDPASDLAAIARTEEFLFAGDMQAALSTVREGMAQGHRHPLLLALFGETLLRSAATPPPADLSDAQSALETAVTERPSYSDAHLTLGRIYMLNGKIAEAITELELARQLAPRNRAVYAALATAYRKAGKPEEQREALSTLSDLNRREAERMRSSPGPQ
jgi:predicted Zn-dependent protease